MRAVDVTDWSKKRRGYLFAVPGVKRTTSNARSVPDTAEDAHATREVPRSSCERNLSPQGEERTARVTRRSAEVSEAENKPSGIYHL